MYRYITPFLVGLIAGGLIVFLFLKPSTKVPKFGLLAETVSTAHGDLIVAPPSRRITFDSAMIFKKQYETFDPIPYSYFDPKDPLQNTLLFDTLHGLSVDKAAIDSIMGKIPDTAKKADKLYIMLGVRQQKTKTGIMNLFTTVLIGLKDSSLPGQYNYLQNNVFDYSNPCPPFCPTDPTKPPSPASATGPASPTSSVK